jgi:hypothetical protein
LIFVANSDNLYLEIKQLDTEKGGPMSEKLFFEIPNDQEVKAKLVEAVPNDWTWVNGILGPSEDLVSSGRVVSGTGIAIQRLPRYLSYDCWCAENG